MAWVAAKKIYMKQAWKFFSQFFSYIGLNRKGSIKVKQRWSKDRQQEKWVTFSLTRSKFYLLWILPKSFELSIFFHSRKLKRGGIDVIHHPNTPLATHLRSRHESFWRHQAQQSQVLRLFFSRFNIKSFELGISWFSRD